MVAASRKKGKSVVASLITLGTSVVDVVEVVGGLEFTADEVVGFQKYRNLRLLL